MCSSYSAGSKALPGKHGEMTMNANIRYGKKDQPPTGGGGDGDPVPTPDPGPVGKAK